jgi:hypothetical protein
MASVGLGAAGLGAIFFEITGPAAPATSWRLGNGLRSRALRCSVRRS